MYAFLIQIWFKSWKTNHIIVELDLLGCEIRLVQCHNNGPRWKKTTIIQTVERENANILLYRDDACYEWYTFLYSIEVHKCHCNEKFYEYTYKCGSHIFKFVRTIHSDVFDASNVKPSYSAMCEEIK